MLKRNVYVTFTDYNDYQLVHDLARRGNDIALHSITHQTNTQYWKDLSEEGWTKEFLGKFLSFAAGKRRLI